MAQIKPAIKAGIAMLGFISGRFFLKCYVTVFLYTDIENPKNLLNNSINNKSNRGCNKGTEEMTKCIR